METKSCRIENIEITFAGRYNTHKDTHRSNDKERDRAGRIILPTPRLYPFPKPYINH
jgi:hypothetical protein